MNNQAVISTLNNLIETCKDGEQGFTTCGEDVNDVELKKIFTQAAQRCREGAEELQREVRRLGGDAETHGSITGTLFRAWVDIKSAITGKDAAGILVECERGEDAAVRSYRNALEKGLPAETRAIVERQYQGVVENHDRVRSLRDRYLEAR